MPFETSRNRSSGELTRKRNEIKKKLAEIDRFTGGIKHYRNSHEKHSKRHFNLNV